MAQAEDFGCSECESKDTNYGSSGYGDVAITAKASLKSRASFGGRLMVLSFRSKYSAGRALRHARLMKHFLQASAASPAKASVLS